MHITDNPDTASRLWGSLEMTYWRRQLIFCGVMAVFMLIIAARMTEPFGYWATAGILEAVCVLPLVIFYGYRIWKIFRRKESYIFCRAQLSQPHQMLWAKTMYFSVLVETPEGRKIPRETRAIFLPYGIMEPLAVDYVNQTATIGYNPETENVVVIG